MSSFNDEIQRDLIVHLYTAPGILSHTDQLAPSDLYHVWTDHSEGGRAQPDTLLSEGSLSLEYCL